MSLGIKIPRNALAKGAADYAENPNREVYTPDPGTYLGVIQKIKGVDSKGGQLVADIALGGELENEEARGKVVSLWFSFEPERVIFLFRFLDQLGYDVDGLDPKRLEEIAEEIESAQHVVRIRCFEKDGYVNTKIIKVMTELTADEVNAGEGVAPDTDGSASDGAGKVGAGTDKGKKDKKSKSKEAEPAEDDLSDLARPALKKIVLEEEMDIEGISKLDDDALREAMRAIRAERAESGASPAADSASDDLDDMDRKALKAVVLEEELEIDGVSKMDDDDLKTAIREARTAKGDAKPADEGQALEIGSKVSFKVKGVTHKGVVQKIDYDNNKVTIKSKTDNKLYNEVPDKLSPA